MSEPGKTLDPIDRMNAAYIAAKKRGDDDPMCDALLELYEILIVNKHEDYAAFVIKSIIQSHKKAIEIFVMSGGEDHARTKNNP